MNRMKTLRILLGGVLFAGGVWAVLAWKILPSRIGQGGLTASATRPNADLFYKSIGLAPQGFGSPVETEPLPARYTLEISSKYSQGEAEKLVEELSAQGVEAFFTPLAREGRVLYRIRTGVFNDPATAQSAQQALLKRHQVEAAVARL